MIGVTQRHMTAQEAARFVDLAIFNPMVWIRIGLSRHQHIGGSSLADSEPFLPANPVDPVEPPAAASRTSGGIGNAPVVGAIAQSSRRGVSGGRLKL